VADALNDQEASKEDGEASGRSWHAGDLAHQRNASSPLGEVEAADAEIAISAAIEKYDIRDPEQQKRLAAPRIR
jgi:hypothetical protein